MPHAAFAEAAIDCAYRAATNACVHVTLRSQVVGAEARQPDFIQAA